jgi:hypothetical protein
MKFKQWLIESTTSEEFRIHDVDAEMMYELFKDSYEKSTGHAWDFNTFMSRANDWTFYGVKPTSIGDKDAGFVAVRFQRSGPIKLTGMAGNPRAIYRGLDQVIATGKPIWGGVTEDIAQMATRKGFIIPPKSLLAIIGPYIPGFNVNDHGNIIANITGGVGEVEKTLIVNDAYLDWAEKQYPNAAIPIRTARAGMKIATGISDTIDSAKKMGTSALNWLTGNKKDA